MSLAPDLHVDFSEQSKYVSILKKIFYHSEEGKCPFKSSNMFEIFHLIFITSLNIRSHPFTSFRYTKQIQHRPYGNEEKEDKDSICGISRG